MTTISPTPMLSIATNRTAKAVDRVIAQRLIACVSRVHEGRPALALDAATARRVCETARSESLIAHVPVGKDGGGSLACQGVPLGDQLKWYPNSKPPVVLFNTSGARSATECAAHVELLDRWSQSALDSSIDVLFKVELFDEDLHCRNAETIKALEQFSEQQRRRSIPIIEPDPESVRELVRLGVPALRVRVGAIRSNAGLQNVEGLRQCVVAADSAVPIVAEGGLASCADIALAAQLGADAVLFNSAIGDSSEPVALVERLRAAADQAW